MKIASIAAILALAGVSQNTVSQYNIDAGRYNDFMGTRIVNEPVYQAPMDSSWEERLSWKSATETGVYALYCKEAEAPPNRGYGQDNIADYQIILYYKDPADHEAANYSAGTVVSRFRIPLTRDYQMTHFSKNSNWSDLSDEAIQFVKEAMESRGVRIDVSTVESWYGDDNDDDEEEDGDSSDLGKLQQSAIDNLRTLHGLEGGETGPFGEYDEDTVLALEGEAEVQDLISRIRKEIAKLTKTSVNPPKPDEIGTLPPGSVKPHVERPDSADMYRNIPVQPIEPPRKQSTPKTPELTSDGELGTKNPMQQLADVTTSLKTKGSTTEIELPNGFEFTLVRKGRKEPYAYEVTHDDYMDESERDQFVDALGATIDKKGRFKSGWGRAFLEFGYDSGEEAWELSITQNITAEQVLELVKRAAKVITNGTAVPGPAEDTVKAPPEAAKSSELDLPLPSDIVPKAPKPGAFVSQPDKEHDYYDGDEWHKALIGAGFERSASSRYTMSAKQGSSVVEVSVKLVPVPASISASSRIKQAIIVHNKKQIGTLHDTPEEVIGITQAIFARAGLSIEPKAPTTETIVTETGTTVQSKTFIVEQIYLLEVTGTDFIAVDGESDSFPALAAQDFIWHPATWRYAYKSKAKALGILTQLKARGIIVSNEPEIIKMLNGREPTVPRKITEIFQTQKVDSKRKPADMTFRVDILEDDDDTCLVITDRPSCREAALSFKKLRFDKEDAGYWRPVQGKAEAKKILVALHAAGMRLADPGDFDEDWDDTYGGKLGVDFAAATAAPAPKPAPAKKTPAAKPAAEVAVPPRHLSKITLNGTAMWAVTNRGMPECRDGTLANALKVFKDSTPDTPVWDGDLGEWRKLADYTKNPAASAKNPAIPAASTNPRMDAWTLDAKGQYMIDTSEGRYTYNPEDGNLYFKSQTMAEPRLVAPGAKTLDIAQKRAQWHYDKRAKLKPVL